MKITLSTSEAIQKLQADEYARWTYDEAKALVDYYEALEADIELDIEFDPVAIRSEWSHYDGINEVKSNYDCIKNIDDLKDKTQVIELDDSLLVAEF